MAKPITSNPVLTGKAAKEFRTYVERATPSAAKKAMVDTARAVRDQLRPKQ